MTKNDKKLQQNDKGLTINDTAQRELLMVCVPMEGGGGGEGCSTAPFFKCYF